MQSQVTKELHNCHIISAEKRSRLNLLLKEQQNQPSAQGYFRHFVD